MKTTQYPGPVLAALASFALRMEHALYGPPQPTAPTPAPLPTPRQWHQEYMETAPPRPPFDLY